MCGNCLRTFILRTKWRVFFNVQDKRFKIVNLFGFCVCEGGKQLSLISGISSALCGKYRNYAEDADFRELCGSASPHPVRCHVQCLCSVVEVVFVDEEGSVYIF